MCFPVRVHLQMPSSACSLSQNMKVNFDYPPRLQKTYLKPQASTKHFLGLYRDIVLHPCSCWVAVPFVAGQILVLRIMSENSNSLPWIRQFWDDHPDHYQHSSDVAMRSFWLRYISLRSRLTSDYTTNFVGEISIRLVQSHYTTIFFLIWPVLHWLHHSSTIGELNLWSAAPPSLHPQVVPLGPGHLWFLSTFFLQYCFFLNFSMFFSTFYSWYFSGSGRVCKPHFVRQLWWWWCRQKNMYASRFMGHLCLGYADRIQSLKNEELYLGQ